MLKVPNTAYLSTSQGVIKMGLGMSIDVTVAVDDTAEDAYHSSYLRNASWRAH